MESSKNIINHISNKLLKFFTSRYFWVLLFAGVWMVFFDRYNLISQYKMKEQIKQLQKDEVHYQKSIEKLDFEADRLFNDQEELEKFAREKYYMKKPGEDIYVIVEED
ncbi:MAG: septum formation initiator family protein [Bacteroidetes bacterium]|nr:septum formation initiator family protein [Bacteroidota bacterium]